MIGLVQQKSMYTTYKCINFRIHTSFKNLNVLCDKHICFEEDSRMCLCEKEITQKPISVHIQSCLRYQFKTEIQRKTGSIFKPFSSYFLGARIFRATATSARWTFWWIYIRRVQKFCKATICRQTGNGFIAYVCTAAPK